MAASKREQILVFIEQLLADALPFEVVRSPYAPIEIGKSEACIVNWQRASTTPLTGAMYEHDLQLSAGMLCRSPAAETNSDAHLVQIHKLIMQDRTFSGLAQDTELIGASVQREPSDQNNAVITHQYRVTFKTKKEDISQ